MVLFTSLFHIIGSLAVFLYGMKLMSDGLQKSAGERLHSILNLMTVNRFTAVITGVVVTCLIQSSSATTVMVVSFVNAAILSLTQAIGVIMGANIGTTITGWLVSLFGFKWDITALALPCIAIGFPFLFAKRSNLRNWGETIIGIGILLLGLGLLKQSIQEIREDKTVLDFLKYFSGHGFFSILFYIFAGMIVTAIIQSSSAFMAMVITMASFGWMDYETACALMLGSNIGTTITTNLAAISTNLNARRAAVAHTIFNVVGVILALFLFKPLVNLADWIIPGDPLHSENIHFHLSLFHTIFNVANTMILIWSVPYFAKLVEFLVKPMRRDLEKTYKLRYISTPLQETAELNIIEAKREIHKMADITKEMFDIFMDVFNNPQKKMRDEVDRSKEMEELTDQMQVEISQYLLECLKRELNDASAQNVNSMLRITHELETIADTCYNLMILAQRRYDKKMKLDKASCEEINEYSMQVKDFIRFYYDHLGEHLNSFDLERAYELETSIDQSRNKLKKTAQSRLQKGADVKKELLFLDIIRHFERIGDYSLNISQALQLMT
ncbi:MAG: Na/Pi cotransporter family protein [Spirochaetales bacterium]|nr:Na/Pi cotransporter family protein [Spirochaetales bacterium]